MLKNQVLTTILALGLSARNAAPLDTALVQPWLDKHLPSLSSKAQALRDGATWTEVGALLEAGVQAAQELKPVLAGTARAAFVLAVVQSLVREFTPPSANTAWLQLLLNSPYAAMLVEMAFKRLFPGG